jgi:gp16 family phage-associated protein
MNIDDVKNLFNESGISISEWARVRGFSTGLVYQVLDGRRKCERGQSHKIAVALGLKDGKSIDINTFNQKLEEVLIKGGSMSP